MNENYLIKSVRRVTKSLFSKYEILAVPLCSFGLVRAQNPNGKHFRTVSPAFNGEPIIGVSTINARKILLSISINLLLLNLIP